MDLHLHCRIWLMIDFFTKLLKRRSFYRATFNTTPGQVVLEDLRKFTRFGESPLVVSTVRQQVDPIATAVQIGRQEVYSRIVHHLHLDDSKIINMKDTNHDE
jgi:ABC-type uncharacterized transport system fused permease/ATPase subunit